MCAFAIGTVVCAALVPALLVHAAPALLAQGPPTLVHARQQFDARNFDVAKAEYATLAKATPSDITPVMFLGRIALAQNRRK